ncbi:hypothetical protein [Halobacillus sp. A5]|uniref:hypothetical protein n=1 Tax=Halobacillus sp. A5 TaxID=2880263 RepID=UPI0020A68973|nr:hypothetical protein [Halobacillus sp. A5]MCP3028972.1 hypothetical protein [Halobacillus sp. A5]
MSEGFCPMCGCQIGCFTCFSKECVNPCPVQHPKKICAISSEDELILLQDLKYKLQQLIGWEVEFSLKNNEKLRGEVRSVGENFVEILVKNKNVLFNDHNEVNDGGIDNDK